MNRKRNSNKKGGRPSQIIKRAINVGTRVTEAEVTMIKEKARLAGISLSHYLRQTALETVIQPRLTLQNLELIKQVINIDNNVTLMAKQCRDNGGSGTMNYSDKLHQQLSQLQQTLSNDKQDTEGQNFCWRGYLHL